MTRCYSQELHKARKEGAVIVCSMAPYASRPVIYEPRRKSDPKPWVLADDVDGHSRRGYRYSGRECHAEGPNGGPWAVASLLTI